MASSQAPTGIKTLVYLIIGTQFVAVALCLLILFALPIPLLVQLANGTYYQRTSTLSQRRRLEPPYSTYNLYLVYLALADLAFLLPTFAADLCTLTGNFQHDRFWSGSVALAHPPPPNSVNGLAMRDVVGYPYSIANCWINAVIAYEVWLLLQTTRRGQRIIQPSLRRVNLEGGIVIGGSMVFGIFQYYMFLNFKALNFSDSYFAIFVGVFIFLLLVPFFYAIGVTIFVKCRGYMPPSGTGSTRPRDRAVRGLALYFFRVATVFVSIWVPAVGCEMLALRVQGETANYLFLVTDLVVASQPILTFWMILGKDDVNKYIQDFVTLAYFSGSCTCCKRNKNTTEEADLEIANERRSSRRKSDTITILGYNFEEDNGLEANGDANRDATGDSSIIFSADAQEQEFDTEHNDVLVVGDSSADDVVASMLVDRDKENEEHIRVDANDDGSSKYKSRRIRRGEGPAVRVLATGETCPISIPPENPAETV